MAEDIQQQLEALRSEFDIFKRHEHFFDGERLRLDAVQDDIDESEITLSDVTTNDVSSTDHGLFSLRKVCVPLCVPLVFRGVKTPELPLTPETFATPEATVKASSVILLARTIYSIPDVSTESPVGNAPVVSRIIISPGTRL